LDPKPVITGFTENHKNRKNQSVFGRKFSSQILGNKNNLLSGFLKNRSIFSDKLFGFLEKTDKEVVKAAVVKVVAPYFDPRPIGHHRSTPPRLQGPPPWCGHCCQTPPRGAVVV
jgi:hypothetical protein